MKQARNVGQHFTKSAFSDSNTIACSPTCVFWFQHKENSTTAYHVDQVTNKTLFYPQDNNGCLFVVDGTKCVDLSGANEWTEFGISIKRGIPLRSRRFPI